MNKPLRLAFLLSALLLPATAFADKDFIEPSEGDTWDCGSDPVVNINYSAAKFTLTGACTEVNLNGGNGKLTIAGTDTLNINGAKNGVAVGELGAAHINGASNKVTWKKAKTGKKPKVATNGRGNSVTKAK